MGCGASVDGDTDSQESEEEFEKNPNHRRDGPGNQRHMRTPRGQPKNDRRPRRRSQESTASAGYSSEEQDEDDDRSEGSPMQSRNKRPNGDRNGYPPGQRIAVVSDMVPYPAGAGARGDGDLDSLDIPPANTGLFVDTIFPPSEASLYHNKRQRDPDLRWMRPHELSNNPELLVNGASRHDIVQGVLADCWFLSSCAAVAQRSDLMEQESWSLDKTYRTQI